jgi:Ankyrin repeats (many copies)/Ankyrin repeat
MQHSFSAFVRAIIDGEARVASRFLTTHPEFATQPFGVGATRGNATSFFYQDIAHYCYQGDTALHMASAAFQRSTARLLVRNGAALDAKNRRGAEPLHYAADANRWAPGPQAETIRYLLSVGANANARDANGATPLHRAVRTRSAMAVRALLAGGADVRLTNKNGSTPFDLATRDTGRSGSGSPLAREQQKEIIAVLLEAGARPGGAAASKRSGPR